MLDYQRIVDDVRSALFNNGQDGDDFLQAAAADYSLAIDEANERLRQCGGLLRKGLRSEAIQLCEIEPNLLDVAGILDFPERDSWNELLALHDIASPAALMLDVAANLNEAYAVEQPLGTLLQRHRLLAMSRGPIKLRLETLRGLAAADPETAIWDEDVRIFEEERVKELEREVPQAIAKGDAVALNALADELEQSPWRIDRPQAFIQQIAAARSLAARQQGLGALGRVADALHSLHAAFDVDGARGARIQWESLFAAWGRFADPALLQGVSVPLEWLREQDELAQQSVRHEAALAALDQALAARRGAADLERLHREAARDGEVPPELEQSVRRRMAEIDRAARRRMWISVAAFAGFLLVLGGVITTVVMQHLEAAKADAALASLEQLVRDNNVDEARNFIDQLTAESPQIAADLRIQEIGSRLARQQRDEDGRRKAFATALELLRKSIDDKLPDNDALARAKKLAVSDDDKTTVRKAEQDIAKLGEAVQSKVDQDFLAELKEIKERVATAEKDLEDKPDAAVRKLNELGGELDHLLASHPQISEAAKKPCELLRGRLKDLAQEAHTVNDRAGREEAITAALGDNAAFRKRLLDFADKFPDARRSGSFRAVADETPLWDWVARWNHAVQSVGRQDCARFDRKTAADAVSNLRNLLNDRPGHPDAEVFRQRLPYLEAIVRRTDGEGNSIEAALKPVFNDPLVAGVWMLTDSSGLRYYLLEDPAAKLGPLLSLRPERTYGFEYVVGFDLAKKRTSLRGSEIKGGESAAPQRAAARTLSSILDATADNSWEPSFCRMIQTVMNDKDSDPLLRHFLLRKIVDVGCQGSLCLRKGFGGYAERAEKLAGSGLGQLGGSKQLGCRGAAFRRRSGIGQVARLR